MLPVFIGFMSTYYIVRHKNVKSLYYTYETSIINIISCTNYTYIKNVKHEKHKLALEMEMITSIFIWLQN